MKPEQRLCVMWACSVFLASLSWLTLSASAPTLLAPLNLVVAIPLFLSDEFPHGPYYAAACLYVPLVFCAWCCPIFLNESPAVPARTNVLWGGTVLLSMVYLATGSSYAAYHTRDYMIGTAMVSAICWVALGALALRAKRHPSFRRNVVFHVALFAWLAWYAFPYLGELP